MEEKDLIQHGYRYALSLTHHHYDAEDLVQQAWIKLHKKYGTVENKNILFTTVKNIFLDRYRKNQIVVFEALENQDTPTKDHSPGAEIDMETILSTLKYEEREALYLNIVEGFTAKEIAKQTGKSRGGILSLIFRAKKKLEKTFSETDDGKRRA
ncbi:MAG: sigma-70 family RNA polymerase sigma factor [Verrucomicrobiota bacterium]